MTIKDLTEAQALAALSKDPEHCPYCGGDFEGEGVDIQDSSKAAQQECTCMDCNASFYVNYKFSHANLISGPVRGEDDEDDNQG